MTTTEVWLYGSSARGDRDAASDVDVLVAGDESVDLNQLSLPSHDRLSLTLYSWLELEQMARYGSLFLHHLRLEGVPLVESEHRRLRSLLGSLGHYDRAFQELRCFRQVLDDVETALTGDHSPAFELSVVATAARHAAILGCYLIGEPDFGRTSAFQRLLPRIGYSAGFVKEVEALYAYRQAENDGRLIATSTSSEEVRQWVMNIRVLLTQVEDLVT
jgi:hypothetical protein